MNDQFKNPTVQIMVVAPSLPPTRRSGMFSLSQNAHTSKRFAAGGLLRLMVLKDSCCRACGVGQKYDSSNFGIARDTPYMKYDTGKYMRRLFRGQVEDSPVLWLSPGLHHLNVSSKSCRKGEKGCTYLLVVRTFAIVA